MDLAKTIENRYSCRLYTSDPVSDEQLTYIKECVRLAPSACNKQPWKFHIVKSEMARQNLQQCYNREWFKTAPVYVIASILHDQEWVRGDGKQHGNIDIAIAVEHLCLAATEQGLGTCWICNFDAALVSRYFHLPDNEEPAVLIPIGKPASAMAPKTRKPVNEIFVEE